MALWHRHKWKVRAVSLMFEVNNQFPNVRKPVTEVLMVCEDCGSPETKCLDGHWRLGDLLQTKLDKDFFGELGVKV